MARRISAYATRRKYVEGGENPNRYGSTITTEVRVVAPPFADVQDVLTELDLAYNEARAQVTENWK